MKTWLLHTTNPDEVAKEVVAISEGRKRFIWVHVFCFEERVRVTTMFQKNGLLILDAVPCWFVLACNKSVDVKDQQRMVKSIIEGLLLLDIRWRGKQFGYPEEEIDWYEDECLDSVERARKFGAIV